MVKINLKSIIIGSIAILSFAGAIIHNKTSKNKSFERKDDIIDTLSNVMSSPISFDTKSSSEPSTLVKAFTYPGNFWYWMIKGSYDDKK